MGLWLCGAGILGLVAVGLGSEPPMSPSAVALLAWIRARESFSDVAWLLLILPIVVLCLSGVGVGAPVGAS